MGVERHAAGDPDRNQVFARERRQLLAVAFRILGTEADAQDVLQEAWIRFARAEADRIDNVAAWLTTVVTRLCLDRLRQTREVPHETAELPEPDNADDIGDPEQIAVLAGELTEAMALVLDRLTPPQRVALVLHDVFGAPFEEVAHVLGTTPGSAKKLASRARVRVRASAGPADVDPLTARRLVSAFLDAAQRGDVDGLLGVLHPDVTRTADPQVLRAGVAQRSQGARATMDEILTMQAQSRVARLATINGRPGVVVSARRQVRIALVFDFADGRIRHYDVISDPRRLAVLYIAE